MSIEDPLEARREMIIVRRGGQGHDDEHHGGVWKIAFADFMTAMMCFFLVMWLVNAANEQTRLAVASYFNPVKLRDHSASQKGIDDLGKGERHSNNPEETNDLTSDRPVGQRRNMSGPASDEASADTSDTHHTSDQHLFADPFAVLAEIAQETATLQNISSQGDGGAQDSGPATGASGGESYRDPFAPDFWSQQVAAADPVAEGDDSSSRDEQPAAAPTPAPQTAEQPADAAEIEAMVAALQRPQPEANEAAEAEAPADTPAESRPEERAERLAEHLREQLAELFGQDAALNQTVSIRARRDGVVISLTDELRYGMFQIGSALPQRQLVLAMERIGAALQQLDGEIVIMGHTDGRPFRSADYDNWRLSTARAHAAYYMLVRGGLDEERVSEIAGHADRMLRVPAEPFADENRRIEILLKVDG